MQTKKFSSYAQLDRELEILKIEKEINYQKLVLGFQKTKESLSPQHIIGNLFSSLKTSLAGSYGTVLSVAIPLIIKLIKYKKRGC